MPDGDAFTQDVEAFTPIGGRNGQDSTVAAGDAGVARITPNRALFVNLRDSNDQEMGVDVTMAVALGAAVPAGTNNIGDVDIASLPNEGQQTMANSISVAVASNQSAIPVSGTVSVTEPVSVDDNGGSLTVDAPLATPVHVRVSDGTDVNTVTAAGELNVLASAQPGVDIGDVTVNNAAGAAAVNIQDGGNTITVDGAVTLGAAIPAGNNNIGDVDVASVVPGTGATNLGKAEDAPFTTGDVGVPAWAVRNDATTTTAEDGDYAALQLNFDLLKTQAQIYYANAGGARTDVNDSAARALSVKNYQPTATRTQVADSATDVSLLAANTDRKKYAVYNDSTAVLYLADGAAATTTNYTVQIPPNGYFENVGYVGAVRGIWATDPGTGAARITEYT